MAKHGIPWKGWVLVCDGSKALMLQNEGDDELINLKVVDAVEEKHEATHEMGTDRPGIVREISQVLATHGVSIEQLSTSTRHAPMAGGMLFEAEAVLELPVDTDRNGLRVALEAVANELMVDLDIYVDD